MMKIIAKVALGALASVALAAPAMAGPAGQYQVTFVPGQLAGLSDIQMPDDRAGKLKIKMKGADKDGLGGYEVQVAGNAALLCASNPDPKKGLCGPKDNPQPAVLVMKWKVLVNIEIENVAELRIAGGKIVFLEGGKNKSNAGGNVAASTLYETAVAIGYVTINDRAAGYEDPALGCDGSPTVAKTECYNSYDAMSAGFMYGFDLTNSCSDDATCQIAGPTLECNTTTGYCAVQTCPNGLDSECSTGLECNQVSGNCCDPSAAEGDAGACPAASPSGAFLDNVQF